MMYCGIEMNVLNFGIKKGRGGITYARTVTVQAGGLQYSMPRVKLDFLHCVSKKKPDPCYIFK